MSTNTTTVGKAALQYRTRKPQVSPYYQCIEDNYEEFENFMGFNPHMHMLASDGCFGCDGIFCASPINIDTVSIEELFRYRVFKMLLSRSLITTSTVELILSWRHSGFGFYCGERGSTQKIAGQWRTLQDIL